MHFTLTLLSISYSDCLGMKHAIFYFSGTKRSFLIKSILSTNLEGNSLDNGILYSIVSDLLVHVDDDNEYAIEAAFYKNSDK